MIDYLAERAWLAEHHQEHLLDWYEALDEAAQLRLLAQLDQFDWGWIQTALTESYAWSPANSITPYDDVIIPGADADQDQRAQTLGTNALAAGQVAVLLVAGGLGTRLGWEGPKGTIPFGPVSRCTLFELHLQRLQSVQRRFGVCPRVYVMTSAENDAATREFLQREKYFGFPADRIAIFSQHSVPVVDEEGKILLAAKDHVAMSPNGNGGLYAGLDEYGLLDQMKREGIEILTYIQVDNALALGCDPLFIGYHLLRQSEFSCKAILKRSSTEPVGCFARVNGRLTIVEYTEIPEALAASVGPDGQLLYGFANPGLFCWSRAFLTQQAQRSLPIHRAHKRVTHIDKTGEVVVPTVANAYKLELFAMDALPLADKSCVMACPRLAEFAPIKNAKGDDSVQTAQRLLTELHRSWVSQAGGTIARDVPLEISPLYALDEHELVHKLPRNYVVDKPTYLR